MLVGEGKTYINFISIVGMGGSGKTTLARKLYNHPYVKECFNYCAWVFVSQESSTQHVLSQILRKVGGPEDTIKSDSSVDELVDKLRGILEKRSYMIVLDDVWNKQVLRDILPALPREKSKIIITTRNKSLVQFITLQQNQYIHETPPLNDEESWELFSKIVFNDDRTANNMESLENLAKEMLKKCHGLPLAIVALSGILRTKHGINEWQEVNRAVRLKVMESDATHKNGKVRDMLALSYDDLPYHLKPCFLYLSVFPEDCQIPVGMLVRMWIAEGLVTSREGMSLEEVAIQHVEELSQHFMVQIARTNLMGEIKAIRLHDLLRDISIEKANEQSFLKIYGNNMECQNPMDAPHFSVEPRRYALHSSMNFPEQVTLVRSLTMLTRSSLSNTAYTSRETLDLEAVYKYYNFRLLRLLNLWGIETANGTLPAQIGSLVHLRYLGIRASNIAKLPSSIGNLSKLLTLDYRNVDSEVPIKLPKTLRKLEQLRHLFLPVECPWSVVVVNDLPLSDMKNLQMLWGVKQDTGGNWLSRELIKLGTSIKKLKVFVSSNAELMAAFRCPSLNGLHTFQCVLRNNVVVSQFVEPISQHQYMHKLYLDGEIQTKLCRILPSNLVILELKDSQLKYEDPMEATGALPHLKHLRLLNSYLGTAITSKSGSFPQLEELYLANLNNLNHWIIENGSMSRLQKLTIQGCKKLLQVPKGLAFVTTLQDLECPAMPMEFRQQATECGWSHKSFLLPRNFEALVAQISPLDDTLPSIRAFHDQLFRGVFLNNKTLKYWVIEHGDRFYNCFMLYATDIIFSQRDDEWHPRHRLNLNYCLRWMEHTESDGTLTTVAVMPESEHTIEVQAKINAKNLSLDVMYEVAFVLMLPASPYAQPLRHMCTYYYYLKPDLVETTDETDDDSWDRNYVAHTDEWPREEWIRVTVGNILIYDEDLKEMTFILDNVESGVLIKGLIIEPKL